MRTLRAVTAIAKGLGWTEVIKPVTVIGAVTKDTTDHCYELGATVAANMMQ